MIIAENTDKMAVQSVDEKEIVWKWLKRLVARAKLGRILTSKH
jgi:hypothetical protein